MSTARVKSSRELQNEVLLEELDEEEEEEMQIPKIKIGVCAMNKKTRAQPMQEILNRMAVFNLFEIVMFTDDIIKNETVENWPLCDCLISFYSSGFPLDKAIEYAKLRKPFVLNDLQMQYNLMDRRIVYEMLQSEGLDTPRYAILMRDEDGNPINTTFVENDDSVQIGDVVFQKPFVEKPVNAEDHNVYIYYPISAGGGSQRLFRKVASRSSEYSTESSVRKKGSFLYEDFVPTDGTDIKVYTVGPEYAHAEARKSPSLDGKVERDSQGKEIRYPVILNSYEKELAIKVCNKFKQTVCGFDILRTPGKSYVCDVNGFSFVKTSKKYYDDTAQVLASTILQELAPQLYTPYNLVSTEELAPITTLDGTMLELRCVVGVIRHGDRTPKQKMKMEVWHPRFIQLFEKYGGFDEKKLKLKRPKQLQEVLDIARDLLKEVKEGAAVMENPNKLHQMKSVLEMYGHFSGINRKIQFKYLGRHRERDNADNGTSSSEDKARKRKDSDTGKALPKKRKAKDTMENKEQTDAGETGRESLLLILKWGGELTAMGREQAEELGKAFRCMYPGGQGEYASFPGGGLLRLHSTYRHDLKIYASDEGRVQMTAAAFAKGFLALEGELTPILVHLVRSDKSTTEMLDTSDDANKIMAKVKHRLHDILHSDQDFSEEDIEKLAATKATSLMKAIKTIKNPKVMCSKLYTYVQSLASQLKELVNQKKQVELYHDETLELMMRRWAKLGKDFKLKNGQFDISLIPDIYDCIKYDVQHNSQVDLDNTFELYQCAKALADIVMPQEYGITTDEKLAISQRVCLRLMKKIYGDLKSADQSDVQARLNPQYSQSVVTPHRHVRTRLYFTSESHVHSFVNALRYGKLFEENTNEQWKNALDYLSELSELNYITQIVLMLYEDPKADPQSDKRFHIEFHFSPGAKTVDQQRATSTDPLSPREACGSNDSQGTSKEDPGGCLPVTDVAKPRNESVTVASSSRENVPVVSPLVAPRAKSSSPAGQTQGRSSESPSSMLSPTERKERGDVDESDDRLFDDVVYEYSRNERPRYSIGCDDYSDSQPTSRSDSANTSSGVSIDDSSADRPYSKSDTQLMSSVLSQDVRSRIQLAEDEMRRLSDSDVRTCGDSVNSRPIDVPSDGGKEIRENKSTGRSEFPDDSDACLSEDSAQVTSEVHKPRAARKKSHSVSEIERPLLESLDVPKQRSGSQSDQSSGVQGVQERIPAAEEEWRRPRDTRSCKSADSYHPTVRVVQSSPTLKKLSPVSKSSWHSLARAGAMLPTLRVARRLSLSIQSALVVRPYSSTRETSLSKKPPVPDYCRNMPFIQSLIPLCTLHDSLGLAQVEEFLNRMTKGSSGTVIYTPEGTPTRKPPGKRLHLKPATQKRVEKLTESAIHSESLDLSDLVGMTTIMATAAATATAITTDTKTTSVTTATAITTAFTTASTTAMATMAKVNTTETTTAAVADATATQQELKK